MKMLASRAAKVIYAVLLLPVCYSVFYSLVFVLQNVQYSSRTVLMFLLGAGCYILVHIAFYRPMRIYVFGHELVHAISAMLCGARVSSVKVRKEDGAVKLNKVNTFIALSPYVIPFYSVITVLLWLFFKYVVRLKVPVEIVMFLLGFTIMFHLLLTLHAVSVGQTDFNVSGKLFSMVVIFMANCVILAAVFLLLLPARAGLGAVWETFRSQTAAAYALIGRAFMKAARLIAGGGGGAA